MGVHGVVPIIPNNGGVTPGRPGVTGNPQATTPVVAAPENIWCLYQDPNTLKHYLKQIALGTCEMYKGKVIPQSKVAAVQGKVDGSNAKLDVGTPASAPVAPKVVPQTKEQCEATYRDCLSNKPTPEQNANCRSALDTCLAAGTKK